MSGQLHGSRSRPLLLFATVTLIWGTTWFAIKFQLNGTPVAAAVAIRFALAALLMSCWAFATGQHRLERRAFALVAVQGVAFFGLNYVLVYLGSARLTSGLVALVFSTVVLFNLLHEFLLFRQRPAPTMLLAAACGGAGLYFVFGDSAGYAGTQEQWLGIAMVLGAACVGALGNVITGRLLVSGVSIVGISAWGMLAGAVLTAGWATATGAWRAVTVTPPFLLSLGYLAVFGTVIAFALYFALVREIGAARAAYTTVVIPVVALLISSRFEDYVWTPRAAAGLVLVMAGNALALRVKAARTAR